MRKPYLKYANTNIDWLSAIPEDWKIVSLKFIVTTKFSTVDRHELEDEVAVSVCHYPDAYKNQVLNRRTVLSRGTCTLRELENFSLRKGQVVITKDSETPDDIGIPTFVEEDIPNSVCGYHLAILESTSNEFSSKYLFRYMQSSQVKYYFEIKSNGVTRFGLGKPSIENLPVIIPSKNEQEHIASFLDYQCTIIDDLISKKEQLIERLKELRQATINEAVTKGLDTKAKMKASGIEWLGEIPSDWNIVKLKYIAKLNPSRSEIISEISSDTEVAILPMEKVKEDWTYDSTSTAVYSEIASGLTYFRQGDIIIAKITPCFENGKGTYLNILQNGIGFGSTEFHTIRAEKINPKYLFYLTRTDYFIKIGESSMIGSAGQKRVPTDFVNNFMVTLPSIETQEKISNFIDIKISNFDELSKIIRMQNDKVKEYRQSLISETVTGKIDVRDWQPPTENSILWK